MARRCAALILAAFSAAASAADAVDVWAFRFRSSTAMCVGSIDWYDDLIFHNTTDEDLTVRLLSMTGGEGDRTAELDIPARRTISLANLWGMWSSTAEPLWVVHLEVPDGVLTHSRSGGFSWLGTGGAPPSGVPDLGAFTMPVFPKLAPAGETQYVFGADLGAQAARVNVGLYNAGAADAEFTVELRSACDDSVLARKAVTLSPGGVEQLALKPSTTTCSQYNNWSRYVTVTASQPSISYVVNISTEDPCFSFPKVPYGGASAR